MPTEGYIQVEFKTIEDLQNYLELYESDTGGEPLEVDRENLFVEFNTLSHGDHEVFRQFLRERDARIIEVYIEDDEDKK